mgnify:CR=1 FL=1
MKTALRRLLLTRQALRAPKAIPVQRLCQGAASPSTFNGSRKVGHPGQGARIYCDQWSMEVRALEDLCVTYYAQDFGMVQTMALYGATTYLGFW